VPPADLATTVPQTISHIVAPVVMISAACLLCLGLFNRLATLVSRSRAFAAERVALLRHIAAGSPGPAGAALDQVRLEGLEEHAASVLRRATLIRNALVCILSSVLSMLACSAMIGAMLLAPWMAGLALSAFGLGVVLMGTGVVLVIAELSRALRDVRLEHEVLETLRLPTPPLKAPAR
jgi:hypothetical protein